MQRSWLSCAKSDCSMSKNRTTHNRILHSVSSFVITIPQPFGQPPLHKGAFGAVRRRKCCGNLKLHSKGERIAAPVTSVTGSQ